MIYLHQPPIHQRIARQNPVFFLAEIALVNGRVVEVHHDSG